MRLLVAMILLVTVTPIVPETIEAGVHLAVHGDLSHHDEHDPEHHEQGGTDEHGCTPLFHSCGCHLAMSAAPSGAVACDDVIHGIQTDAAALADAALGRVAEPPPLRPPIC